MSKAKIFILAWTVVLATTAVSLYLYIEYFGKPRIGRLNLFAPEPADTISDGPKTEGWLGMLSGGKDLYPAKEVSLHMDLSEVEKNYLITIDKLSQGSLGLLEQNLKDLNINYRVSKEQSGFRVDIDSPTKAKMQARLEIIKTLNITPKH